MSTQIPDFDPRDVIDRDVEEELFMRLVSFETSARMLTICDGGGRGKTSLIKRLHYNCKYHAPPVSACVIALDQLSDSTSYFGLVKSIREELKLGLPVPFPKFDQLDNARMAENFAPFDRSVYTTRSVVTVGGEVQSGAFVAAEVQFTQAETAIIKPARKRLTNEQKKHAQDRCIEAFFEDLRVFCAAKPLVLFLDAWEQCNFKLRQRIEEDLLSNCCFNPEKDLRPAKLAIVLASRSYHINKEPQGLRDDAFRPQFSDEDQYKATVLSIKSLSEWESEHVKAFLEQNDYSNASDEDVDFIQKKLKAGLTFARIIEIVKALRADQE